MWSQLALLIILVQPSHPVGTLVRQAQRAFEAGKFSVACDELTEALKYDPRNARLWTDLGVSYARLNHIEPAIAAFQRSLSISPENSQTLFSLGSLYGLSGQTEQALELYREGLVLDPTNEMANKNYAFLLMDTRKYRTAIEPLRRLKGTRSFDLSVRVALVECYLKSGLKGKGDQELNELLASSAISGPDTLRLADLLIKDGELDAAQMVLQSFINKQPDSAEAFGALGLLLLKERQYKDSARALRQAIELDPNSSKYIRSLAKVLLEGKNPRGALKLLVSVKDQFGADPDFQYKLALSYYQLGRYRNALRIFEQLVRDYPRRADPQFYMGDCYRMLGEYENAEESYRKAIELNPHEAQYYVFLADMLKRVKRDNTKEVIGLLEKALALDPTDPQTQIELGVSYEKTGNLEKAESLLESVVRREPTSPRVHRLLATVYARQGKRRRAAREADVATQLEAAQMENTWRTIRTGANGRH